MVYLYDKLTKRILKYNDSIALNTHEVEELNTLHEESLNNGYGRLEVNDENELVYVENKVVIMVDLTTNDYTRISEKLEDDDNYICREIPLREYLSHLTLDPNDKVVKYYDEKIHILQVDPTKSYDARSNSFITDVDKLKSFVINKIANCEHELRTHGFYHDIIDGNIYLQPFRTVENDNDLNILTSLKNNTPINLRRLKLFKENPKTGERDTSAESVNWIQGGQVTDAILDSLILLNMAYSENVKSGIKKLIDKLNNTDLVWTIEQLEDLKKNYIKNILLLMKYAIENDENNKKYFEDMRKRISKSKTEIVENNTVIDNVEEAPENNEQ